MDGLTSDVCKLVSIQTGSRHTNRTLPVEVKMTELVGKSLVSVGIKVRVNIFKDVVGCWGYGAHTHTLGHQVEVESLRQSDNIITNSPRRSVDWLASLGAFCKQSRVDALADNQKAEAWI
ncbi:unnamed protein product, partial [Meganyctiphanes norvegica]